MFDDLNWWGVAAGALAFVSLAGVGTAIYLLGGVAVLAWLSGSKLGRVVAVIVLSVFGVLLVLARVYSAGASRERARRAQANVETLKRRISKDDEIRNLGPDERLRRLRQWVHD